MRLWDRASWWIQVNCPHNVEVQGRIWDQCPSGPRVGLKAEEINLLVVINDNLPSGYWQGKNQYKQALHLQRCRAVSLFSGTRCGTPPQPVHIYPSDDNATLKIISESLVTRSRPVAGIQAGLGELAARKRGHCRLP